MESGANSTQTGENNGRGTGRKFVVALSTVVGLEALILLAGAIYFLARMFMEPVENLGGAIVILLITLAIAAGLFAAAIACLKHRAWTRGAILVWQILQFAIATSFLQGIEDWKPVGFALLILSVLGILAVLMALLIHTEDVAR